MTEHKAYRNVPSGQTKIEIKLPKSQTFAVPYFVKGTDLCYMSCNEALPELLGISEADVIGKSNREIHSPVMTDIEKELIEQGGTVEFDAVVIRPSGEKRYCVMTESLIKDSEEQALAIVGTIRDVTEERKEAIRVEKLMIMKDAMIEITHAIMDNWSEKVLFDLILEMGVEVIENSDHGAVLMRGENDIFAPVAWVGYTDEAMKEFRLPLKDSFNWVATGGHEEQSVMINDITPYTSRSDKLDIADTEDGAEIKASLCSPIIVDGSVVGLMNMDSSMINAFTDIDMELVDYMSEQIEVALTKRILYDQVLYLSRHDELTGLYNRREFESLTQKVIAHAEKNSESFSLAIFDLNGLKGINDTYGHQMGDTFIQRFAESLKHIFRDTDIIGRYGGDEFVGVFRSMEEDQIGTRIENVYTVLRDNPVEIADGKKAVGFSYGMAHYPEDGTTYESLVSTADKRMYVFKEESR